MANTLGGAFRACRVSTGLDLLGFASELTDRGFRAACVAGARGVQDTHKLAAELQQLEDHDASHLTDAELATLLTCCKQWLTTPRQQTILAELSLLLAIRVLRNSKLPTIIKRPPRDS